jgi:signal transduction histidine kinase/ligand-binding sensor domain-containing protein/DNA-binding NarL/FixJ family response regulator
VSQLEGERRNAIVPGLVLALALLASPYTAFALDPPLQIDQYAHTAWTVRDGYSLGIVFATAQTPDGYLWLAAEFGLFRFDGVHFTPWQPPAGQELPNKPYSLLVSRDGTLWIGTFAGLASWNGIELTHYPEIDKAFVTSLLEARDGTVWAGILADKGQLCRIRGGRAQCYLQDGRFGTFVWSLAEDSSGVLWAGADSGLWRWKPGRPKRYETPGRLGDLITTADGQLLIGIRGAGLQRLAGDKLESYLIRSALNPAEQIPDHDIKSNKLLRDRDGGVWIGTDGRGLIHVKDGKADTFTRADGLSGNISCSLFEDREGNIWFASERGLDRFRKLPVTTISAQQGLSSDVTKSVLASADGSVWVATNDGVTRWKDARPTVFRKASGLPDVGAQSLFQDSGGRVWVSTPRGLAYFDVDRFVTVDGLPSSEFSSIAGDGAGNLWLSGTTGLSRLHNGRFVETVPWSALGRRQRAAVVVPDDGGVWLSFWQDGGVMYFKDGKAHATYTFAEGLGKGHVPGLRRDRDGAVWAATEEGGLSRIKDGRIRTLTTNNGLPCNTIHWSIEDDHRSLWMYTACGLVRVMRAELDAWIADPTRRVATRRWGAADGVMLRGVSPAYFTPAAAKAADGKLWFVSGNGVQVIDPDHLPFNAIPPPVYIENVVADRKPYSVANGLRLPPLVRDVTIEFIALSLAEPRNMQFRYRLDGHDNEWQEAVDRRQVSYANLPPGNYRFHVKASNNSGVWNEKGAQLEFSIASAFYQTNWFRLASAVLFIGLVWSGFQLRLHMRIRRLALTEAERLARLRSEFLAQMSHELRTPLNAILGYAQILLRDEGLTDRQARGLATIQESGDHLLTLINDILDLSRIGASKLDLHPADVNLAAFLRTVCDIIRVKADEKSLLFTYEGSADLPAAVRVDDKRLRQVLFNLLGNAVKFTDRGRITLRVRSVHFPTHTEHDSENDKAENDTTEKDMPMVRLLFEVEDSGIGMTKAQVERIFQPFEQVADVERRQGGAGLGLTISHQLVRLMGGDIQVRSEAGKGSVFSFELDLPVAASQVDILPTERVPIGYTGPHTTILIVDDVAQSRAMLMDVLTPLGFDVVEATNGQEAIDQAQRVRPDLIVMDIMMPVIDGLEATRRIRSSPELAQVPILIASASASSGDASRSLAAGASAFVPKPIEGETLLKAIGEHLGVEWTYKELAEEPELLSRDTAGAMVIPPREEIDVLHKLALVGNMRDICDRANYLENSDPRYGPFAQRLQSLAQSYRSEAILTLVERYRREAAESDPSSGLSPWSRPSA